MAGVYGKRLLRQRYSLTEDSHTSYEVARGRLPLQVAIHKLDNDISCSVTNTAITLSFCRFGKEHAALRVGESRNYTLLHPFDSFSCSVVAAAAAAASLEH